MLVMIDDVNKDRKKIITRAREINEQKRHGGNYPKKELEHAYKEYLELRKNLHEKYAGAAQKGLA